MANSLDEVLVDAAHHTQNAIRAAYEIGRLDGAAEARAEMKVRLAAVVDGTTEGVAA